MAHSENSPSVWIPALCLEAPAIAVAWAWALDSGLAASAAAVLALGVWLGYLADRLLDSFDPTQNTPRHQWIARRRSILTLAWILGLVTAVVLALRHLEPSDLLSGLPLAAAAAIYVALAQWSPQYGHLFKAPATGCLLAAAVHLFSPTGGLPALLALATLFTLNCLVIAAMEARIDCPRRRDRYHRLTDGLTLLPALTLAGGHLLS